LALRFMAHWLVGPSRKMMKEMEANCRRFTERMEHPDFAALVKHFGCRFPACLRALYANRDELSREHFLTMAAQDDPSAEWWHVAYYLPADGESVKEARPRLERYFAFAD